MDIPIRQIEEEDYPEVANILREVFGPEGCGQKWTVETSSERVKEDCWNPPFTFCAEKEGKMVGILLVFPTTLDDGPYLYVDLIGVRSSEQAKGVGSKLWQRAVEVAKEHNLKGVRLHGNPKYPSFRWYQKLGFKESGWVELGIDFTQ